MFDELNSYQKCIKNRLLLSSFISFIFVMLHCHVCILYNKNMSSALRIIYTSDCTLKLYAIVIKNQNIHPT